MTASTRRPGNGHPSLRTPRHGKTRKPPRGFCCRTA
nr:MAG TPA: hypothetical protein [Caudoviricetes sp.]